MTRKPKRNLKAKFTKHPKPPREIWVALSMMGFSGIWCEAQGHMKCNTKFIREDVVDELLKECLEAAKEAAAKSEEKDDADSA